jgi:hypothetical protein
LECSLELQQPVPVLSPNTPGQPLSRTASLGRAPLRARLDAKIALLEGKTMRANAWIDVERAMGMP